MANQITCITKPDPHNSHEAITHVGGVRANGTGFYITRQECAGDIVNRQDTYFVRVGQNRIGVEAYQRHSVWYIKTRPDHTQQDNLLNLPQCQTANRLIMSSGDSRCSRTQERWSSSDYCLCYGASNGFGVRTLPCLTGYGHGLHSTNARRVRGIVGQT
jgi:hypothetical protein